MASKHLEENVFEKFLKKCRDIHEKRRPGAFIDEQQFAEMAKEKWRALTDERKEKFRATNLPEPSESGDVTMLPSQNVTEIISEDNANLLNVSKLLEVKIDANANLPNVSKQAEVKTEANAMKHNVSKQAGVSPFIYFTKTVKEEIKNQHPEITASEVLSLISKRWRNLTIEEKQTYSN
jgi:hypothetical protein